MTRFRRILCPVDFSAATAGGLQPARSIAAATGAEIFLLHVVDFPHRGIATERLYLEVEDEAMRRLDVLAHEADLDRERVHSLVLRGVPYERIVDFVEEQSIDLVVMPTHGRAGLDRMLFGSVTDRVLRLSPAPVIAVPPTSSSLPFAPAKILFGTDFSETADRAQPIALALARALGVDLLIAHVVTLSDRGEYGTGWQIATLAPDLQQKELEAAEHGLAKREAEASATGPRVARRLVRGTYPALEIAELAVSTGAGLVAVASHGHAAVTRALLGSTSEKLVRICPVPVMVIRPAVD